MVEMFMLTALPLLAAAGSVPAGFANASPGSMESGCVTSSEARAARWSYCTAMPKPAICGFRSCSRSPGNTPSLPPTCAAPADLKSRSPATTKRTWPWTSTN